MQVVLRVDSDDAARAWYDDPEYEPIRAIRHASCTNNRMTVAKGFVPPEG